MQSHATHPDIWTYAIERISLKAMLHDEVYVEEEEDEDEEAGVLKTVCVSKGLWRGKTGACILYLSSSTLLSNVYTAALCR